MRTTTQLLQEAYDIKDALDVVILNLKESGSDESTELTMQVLRDTVSELVDVPPFMEFTVAFQGLLDAFIHDITRSLSTVWIRNTSLEDSLGRVCFDYSHNDRVIATMVLRSSINAGLNLMNIVPKEGRLTSRVYNHIAHKFLDEITYSRIPIGFDVRTKMAPQGPKVLVQGLRIQTKCEFGSFFLNYRDILDVTGLEPGTSFRVSIEDAFGDVTLLTVAESYEHLYFDRSDCVVITFDQGGV